VPFGVVEAVNGKHQNAVTSWPRLPRYELSATQGTAAGRHQDQFLVFHKAAQNAHFIRFSFRPK
jgi:hypothetical protein